MDGNILALASFASPLHVANSKLQAVNSKQTSPLSINNTSRNPYSLSPRSVSFNAALRPVEWKGRVGEGRSAERGRRVVRVRKRIVSCCRGGLDLGVVWYGGGFEACEGGIIRCCGGARLVMQVDRGRKTSLDCRA